RRVNLPPPLFFVGGVVAFCQSSDPAQPPTSPSASSTEQPRDHEAQPAPGLVPSDAPHIGRQTRLEIIRDFETQLVYARTAFPMGTKGLHLKQGVVTPNGMELQQA